MYNQDTAKRIRRSLRNRFTQGGVIQFVLFGYVKPPLAKTDTELERDPATAPVYDQIFRMLEEGASFWEVSDWLNGEGIKPGPYARNDRWDGRMLARVVFNPVIKGTRVRNARMSRRVNSTGRRRSVKAPPAERLERHCPHLAFIDPPGTTGWSPCYASAAAMGGHGLAGHMVCSGARDYRCWSAVSFDGRGAADRLGRLVLAAAEAQPAFEAGFMAPGRGPRR
jgi:hypothetical protein